MGRWRYNGTGWTVTPGIRRLGVQVEAEWPERHPADGTVASGGHAKWPASDHGISPEGFVRAIDVGVYGDQGQTLALQLQASRDPRIAYVIHDGRMLRSYPKPGIEPWTWAPYSGSNPHAGHVHLSTLRSKTADADASPWDIDLTGGLNMLRIEDLQTALNAAGQTDALGNPLEVDGVYGEKTEYAFTQGLMAASVPADVLRAGDRVRLRKVTPAP